MLVYQSVGRDVHRTWSSIPKIQWMSLQDILSATGNRRICGMQTEDDTSTRLRYGAYGKAFIVDPSSVVARNLGTDSAQAQKSNCATFITSYSIPQAAHNLAAASREDSISSCRQQRNAVFPPSHNNSSKASHKKVNSKTYHEYDTSLALRRAKDVKARSQS